MRVSRFATAISALLTLISYPVPAGADPVFKLAIGEGKGTVAFGFLAQPQVEWLRNPADSGITDSIYMRRFRLIAGGKITPKLSFFVESDSANLGKKGADGKRITEFFLQDAMLTYTFRPEFQIDGGMLLVPVSHNSQQSAATLLPIDYGAYSFLSSAPTDSRNGRDYGVQLRGYIMKHFEYRLGTFRGHRDNDTAYPFRYAGRFVWYPFQADTGFFYTGSTLGQKRILGIGASFDRQARYSAYAVDFMYDQPVSGGDAVTFQSDFIRYNGGTTFLTLPQQNTWLIEGGYFFHKARLEPFLQLAAKDLVSPTGADERRFQSGLIYWAKKQQFNIKAGLGRLLKDGAQDRMQCVLQTQIFFY